MKRNVTALLLLTFPLVALGLAAGIQILQVRGRWVLDSQGKPVAPPAPEGRMMGLQTSGLDYDGQNLWAVGDQRSNFAGQIFRINPLDGKLVGEPVRLNWGAALKGTLPTSLRTTNPDLEGLCLKRGSPLLFYIAVETDGDYILECSYAPGEKGASILRILNSRFATAPVRDDSNESFEGIAVDGDTLYLAYERDASGNPHIYRGNLHPGSAEIQLSEIPVRFSSLPPRSGKGRINVNGMKLLRVQTPMLVMIARDQERLLFYELDTAKLSYVDMDFRDPEGREVYWVSPEAVALDPEGDRLWVINDPDSRRGNYRLRDEQMPTGNYAAMVPLLFEVRLSQALESRIFVGSQ